MTDTTTALAAASEALPDAVKRRGLDEAQWATLCNSLYPGARPESVLLVVDYCHARRLDPLKKPCHIVPMEVKDAKTGVFTWRDVVLPGIYEHRTTAQRTGEYLGHSAPTWGPELEYKGVKCFEWCALTVYRWHRVTDQKIEFPVRVYFREVVTLTKDGKVNARWTRAPLQMLQKCTEAAALREAFPDELGGEQTAEEVDGASAPERETIDVKPLPPKPAGYDDWLITLKDAAEGGSATLRAQWKKVPAESREYLTLSDPAAWTALKTRAEDVDRRAAEPATEAKA